MITLVQVTHETGTVEVFEADSAKPDKMGWWPVATSYQIITDALIRHDMWHWTAAACEDMDNQTAWMRGPRKPYTIYQELTE